MGKTKIGQKPGIYEHHVIRRDFVFAHGNENVRIQNLDVSRDAR